VNRVRRPLSEKSLAVLVIGAHHCDAATFAEPRTNKIGQCFLSGDRGGNESVFIPGCAQLLEGQPAPCRLIRLRERPGFPTRRLENGTKEMVKTSGYEASKV
jgi:hypothetical protein